MSTCRYCKGSGDCESYSPGPISWFCVRPKGHKGDHVACASKCQVARWPNKDRRPLENKESRKSTPNTGSLQCFNEECPALWFKNRCTSSKGSECSARVETLQASA